MILLTLLDCRSQLEKEKCEKCGPVVLESDDGPGEDVVVGGS